MTRLEPADWKWVNLPEGIRLPVTTPARTIVDLALSGEDHDHVMDAIDEGQSANLLTTDELRDAIERRRRRRGSGSVKWLASAIEAG